MLQRISACDESIHLCFSQSTSVFIKHTVFGSGLNRSQRHRRAPGSVAGRFGAMPTMLSVTQQGVETAAATRRGLFTRREPGRYARPAEASEASTV